MIALATALTFSAGTAAADCELAGVWDVRSIGAISGQTAASRCAAVKVRPNGKIVRTRCFQDSTLGGSTMYQLGGRLRLNRACQLAGFYLVPGTGRVRVSGHVTDDVGHFTARGRDGFVVYGTLLRRTN